MIIGHGMIAEAFGLYDIGEDIVIFASGVSNSLETDFALYKREAELLKKVRNAYPEKLLVYFSTCSISDPDRAATPYVFHKIETEAKLMAWGMPYLILRLPAVIGRRNLAYTFPYFLFEKIQLGKKFDVWSKAVRYPIDISDVLKISNYLITDNTMHNQIINIALRSYPVMEIVREMERIVGKSAVIDAVDRGCVYDIDRNIALDLAQKLDIYYGKNYLSQIFCKYFKQKNEVVSDG